MTLGLAESHMDVLVGVLVCLTSLPWMGMLAWVGRGEAGIISKQYRRGLSVLNSPKTAAPSLSWLLHQLLIPPLNQPHKKGAGRRGVPLQTL